MAYPYIYLYILFFIETVLFLHRISTSGASVLQFTFIFINQFNQITTVIISHTLQKQTSTLTW